jgi:hypothetical protein
MAQASHHHAVIGEQGRQAAAVWEKQAADDRRAADSTALALVVERCRQEALLAVEADVQRCHEEVLYIGWESDVVTLDAILAEIACEEAAFKTTLSPRRPTSYVDAVLSTMGGGTQPSLPLAVLPSALVPAAQPLHDVDNQFQTVHPRAQHRRCTG